MADSGHHQASANPPQREFFCLTYREWHLLSMTIIAVAFVGVTVCAFFLVAPLDLPLSEEMKDVLIGFIAGFLFFGNIVYIVRQLCHYLITKKKKDFWFLFLTVIYSISVYCAFLSVVFYKRHQLTDESRTALGKTAVALAGIGFAIYVFVTIMRQDESKRRGTINTIARSLRTLTRRRNRIAQIPQEPSTISSEINYDYPPQREPVVPSEREITRNVRNPNERLTTEEEIHQGPSTSRPSEQAQASTSVETEVRRKRIRSPTPFSHETTAADESEPIMTRSRTQQQKQSTSRQRSQEIQLLPGQLEESSGVERGELRRKRVEPAETGRRLRPRAAKKTS